MAIFTALFVTFLTYASVAADADHQHAPGYRMHHRRLVDDLLHSFSPDVIPLPNSGAPLNVSITLFLVDILEVDIDRNQVEFLVYLHRQYVDEALRWDPSEYGDLLEVRVHRDLVWPTDVTFEGDIGSVSHQPESPAMAQVKHDGTVSWTEKRRVRTLCQVYALSDRHAAECKVKVASASHDRTLLWLNAPTESTPNTMLFSDATKYMLISITARKDTLHYPVGSYEEMVFTVTFGRITPP